MKALYTNINRNGRVTAAMIARTGAKRMCMQQSCIQYKMLYTPKGMVG